MRFSSTAEFRKQKSCPSTEVLLLHSERFGAGGRQKKLSAHLAACDFCGAEVQLLSRHPPRESAPISTCEIPHTLRLLAEDLMPAPIFNRMRGVETIYEIERLTLTDA